MSKYEWNPKPDHQFNRIFTVNIQVCPTYKMACRREPWKGVCPQFFKKGPYIFDIVLSSSNVAIKTKKVKEVFTTLASSLWEDSMCE